MECLYCVLLPPECMLPSNRSVGEHAPIDRNENEAKVFGLNRDLAIEVKDESRKNRFIDLKKTFKADVCD